MENRVGRLVACKRTPAPPRVVLIFPSMERVRQDWAVDSLSSGLAALCLLCEHGGLERDGLRVLQSAVRYS